MATIGSQPSPPPKSNREVFEITSIVSETIVLAYKPAEYSEFVFVNGVAMTDGSGYDYLINEKTIIFNNGVLTNDGHVLVKYNYL